MTSLAYLTNSKLLNHKSVILGFDKLDEAWSIELESTVFHVKGGGQPSDIGTISINTNTVNVIGVEKREGKVIHVIDAGRLSLQEGDEVEMSVNEGNRFVNSKIHTAGHLIASSVERLAAGLTAVKGYHYPNGSYVEFVLDQSDAVPPDIDLLNQELASLILEGKSIAVGFFEYAELVEKGANVPDFFKDQKSIRAVTIEGFAPMPCGGTHLDNINEMKSLEVTKIKNKKGNIKFSYVVE